MFGMTVKRARELTSGCVHTCTAVMMGMEYVPLPKASLAELLEANEIVEAQPPERINGGVRLRTHCDPRIVALHYAFEHYERNPYVMLNQLGFEIAARKR